MVPEEFVSALGIWTREPNPPLGGGGEGSSSRRRLKDGGVLAGRTFCATATHTTSNVGLEKEHSNVGDSPSQIVQNRVRLGTF